ncbi:unnamed protein product [Cercospora beticola]|nr:unnamed protein product [Cercospora beticola]
MLPRALTWVEASGLYHQDGELEDDELLQVCEWFSNKDMADRQNRSALNRPAGTTNNRTGGQAGDKLDTALNRRAKALGIENVQDLKKPWRKRRDDNKALKKSGLLPTADQVVPQPTSSIVRSRKRAQSDDEYEASPQASRKKRKTRTQAQTAQSRVSEVVPQLTRNDIGLKRTIGPKFGSMVVSSIAGFWLDERENRKRLKWLNPRWLKLITRGETELTAEYLISFFEPDVSVDNLKRAIDQVPKQGQHAARILWLMTVYTWLLVLPDITLKDRSTDDVPLIDRLQRVTELFTNRFESLSLVHLPDSVGPEWSLIYGIHILSHLCPGRSCHVLLAEFVYRYLGHFSAEKLALGNFLDRRDLQHCTLPEDETSVITFMASVTRSAMEIWLKSPQIFEDRMPLFESIVFIAGTRFDPPLFQVDSDEDEED